MSNKKHFVFVADHSKAFASTSHKKNNAIVRTQIATLVTLISKLPLWFPNVADDNKDKEDGNNNGDGGGCNGDTKNGSDDE